MRPNPQPHAGDLAAGGVVGVARRRGCRAGTAEGSARAMPADGMDMWPVSARVGNVRNNDPSLIEPVELTV
jgi:hypothetical protein